MLIQVWTLFQGRFPTQPPSDSGWMVLRLVEAILPTWTVTPGGRSCAATGRAGLDVRANAGVADATRAAAALTARANMILDLTIVFPPELDVLMPCGMTDLDK